MDAVALAVEDKFVGRGLEPVDGGLGQKGIGHHPEPLDRFAIRGHDRGRRAVPLDDEFVPPRAKAPSSPARSGS